MIALSPQQPQSSSRSPNRRAETPTDKKLENNSQPKNDLPKTASSRLTTKLSQSESKSVDVVANRSGSKMSRKSLMSSRLSTPRANQMAPSVVKEDKRETRKRQTDIDCTRRSASTPKSLLMKSSRSGTPSNKSSPATRTSTPSKASTSSNRTSKLSTSTTPKSAESNVTKSSKGPSTRKSVKSPVGMLTKKDSKDESKSPPVSSSLSRAQKAEEKHRRRVTLAQGASKPKSSGVNKKLKSSGRSDPRLHRRSSISRAQSLAYIAKTRTARSSTQGFSNVEGDEAMAMADAIMGAIGTSNEDDEEEEGGMLSEWQGLRGERNGSKSKSAKNIDSDEDGGSMRMVKQSRVMPSFAHLQAGSPRGKNKKKPVLETFTEDESKQEGSVQNTQVKRGNVIELKEKDIQGSSRNRSATTGGIGDDAYQQVVSSALKKSGPWGRVRTAAMDIAAVRKNRSLSVATGDVTARKNIAWTFIDDAMEALSPSRKNQPSSPGSGSPLFDPQRSSPKSVEAWSIEDTLVHQGWLQVHETGSLFSTGWRRRYLMLIRGGRRGAGPRGLGSLLILRKEPTPNAMAALVKPVGGEQSHNKDLCKEISLRGGDLKLHYDKVPSGTFGFLLTHTLGGDLPLTAPSREVRQSWLTELRNVLKRSASEIDREDAPITPTSKDNLQWERERSAVSMPRPSSFSTRKNVEWKKPSSSIQSPLTSDITSPRNAARLRPIESSLKVDVNASSEGMSTSCRQGSSPDNFKDSASLSNSELSRSLSFTDKNRNDRSRSAPSQRPPHASTPNSPLSPPGSPSSSAAPLQWRERMRRAAPARIEELDWDNLVAVATPDDFKDLGVGAGVSSVIVANTGGAVFFAFFKRRPGRSRVSDSSNSRSENTSNKGLVSKSISTVEESDEIENESDDESTTHSSDVSGAGAIRSRVRAKNTLAKGPSVRSSRNSTDIEKLANFGDLDLDLDADGEVSNSKIVEREEDSEGIDTDEEADKSADLSEDEDFEFDEDDDIEQVCILKFCRNLMDTQSEFCANQMAMALHIQVPSCRIMRKKDEEWDQIAAATFDLRRNIDGDIPPWATAGCDALEASLHDTSCGLVFELVHTGCSLKLEHIVATLQSEKDRDSESGPAITSPVTASQPPMLQQMRASSQSSSFVSNSDSEHTSRNTASAVEALNLDPIRFGLPASTSFQSPPIAGALTGGVFNHRRQTLISSGVSGTLISSGSMREHATDSAEIEETGDFREEYLEKAIGEIVGETLVFDIMIRNPDRFPCTGLGWRGNLDNVMWVERSPFSGTRTLWVIDSSIPRRPLRLHVRDDKTAIPNLLKEALLGESSKRSRKPDIHPDDAGLVDIETRTTSSLLYSLVGGDPFASDETSRREMLLFDKQVPAFRRGIRRSLHRCQVLLEKSLQPLHTTLQNYFDEISIELESLSKKSKEKSDVKPDSKTESFATVATAAMKKADEEKPKAKTRPGGGFRQRFNTGDVRMFNLKKEDREELNDSDDDTGSSDPPPPPKDTPPNERLTPVISQMGKKWVTEAKNRDRSGSRPLEMLRSEVPKENKSEMTERDATVIVINNWTRKFWEAGKSLEGKFEEYAIAQMKYEQQLLAASEQLTEKQQELLETAENRGDEGGVEYGDQYDNETAVRAASLAEAAAATTELMRHEPEPVFVTGFIDSGSTNCFAGAYELKIRLEHINNRLRILFKTLDEIGDEDDLGPD